jgi:hypothetical protein
MLLETPIKVESWSPRTVFFFFLFSAQHIRQGYHKQ